MNFPDTALFLFLYRLINTPGIGGLVVVLVGGGVLLSVALALRWIIQGGKADELEAYVYPTPALHKHATQEN